MYICVYIVTCMYYVHVHVYIHITYMYTYFNIVVLGNDASEVKM